MSKFRIYNRPEGVDPYHKALGYGDLDVWDGVLIPVHSRFTGLTAYIHSYGRYHKKKFKTKTTPDGQLYVERIK